MIICHNTRTGLPSRRRRLFNAPARSDVLCAIGVHSSITWWSAGRLCVPVWTMPEIHNALNNSEVTSY